VAISVHRILRIGSDPLCASAPPRENASSDVCSQVTFAWRDRADDNTEKTLTIPAADFIGRLLFHVLPRGFQKVRAYGWLAQRHKSVALAAIRAALGATAPAQPPEGETAPERILRLTGVDVSLCPICTAGHLSYVGQLPRSRDGPP
jgi:hypothetical protein